MPVAERLAPDAILSQTNLSGAVSAIQDDPDSADANWITSPALQAAAAKTLYFLWGAAAVMQDGGTAPANGAAETTGWTVGTSTTNVAVNNSSSGVLGTVRGIGAFAADSSSVPPAPGALNYIRSPNPISGSFANAVWDFAFDIRSVTNVWNGQGRIKFRLYRSPNADGSGATEIGSGPYLTSSTTGSWVLGTSKNVTGSIPAQGVITLDNEYLFVVWAFQVTTAGTGTTNNRVIRMAQGANSRLVTPTLTPTEPNGSLRVSFPTPTRTLDINANAQEFRIRLRRKGTPTGGNPLAVISLAEGAPTTWLSSPQVSSADPGAVISVPWSATYLSDTSGAAAELLIETTNVAGASIEVGAIEWNALIEDAVTKLTTGATVQAGGSTEDISTVHVRKRTAATVDGGGAGLDVSTLRKILKTGAVVTAGGLQITPALRLILRTGANVALGGTTVDAIEYLEKLTAASLTAGGVDLSADAILKKRQQIQADLGGVDLQAILQEHLFTGADLNLGGVTISADALRKMTTSADLQLGGVTVDAVVNWREIQAEKLTTAASAALGGVSIAVGQMIKRLVTGAVVSGGGVAPDVQRVNKRLYTGATFDLAGLEVEGRPVLRKQTGADVTLGGLLIEASTTLREVVIQEVLRLLTETEAEHVLRMDVEQVLLLNQGIELSDGEMRVQMAAEAVMALLLGVEP